MSRFGFLPHTYAERRRAQVPTVPGGLELRTLDPVHDGAHRGPIGRPVSAMHGVRQAHGQAERGLSVCR